MSIDRKRIRPIKLWITVEREKQMTHKKYILVLILTFIISAGLFFSENHKKDYGVFIGSEKQKVLMLRNYQELVIDADYFSKQEIERIRDNGNEKIYSYLNIGSIEKFRSFYDVFRDIIIDSYENWPEEQWIDVTDNRWEKQVSDNAKKLIDKGIDGFFVDNTDVYAIDNKEKVYQSVLCLIRKLSDFKKPIIINGGDIFITEAIERNDLKDTVFAVNQEEVFTKIDFKGNEYLEREEAERQYYQDYLSKCHGYGLKVYLLEYGANAALKNEIRVYCRKNHFIYYIAPSSELD